MSAAEPAFILVVDDDRKIANLLSDYLRAEGYRVGQVANGKQALAHILHSPPQLILLDLTLPELDGISVCRAVRRVSDVPIIIITARVDEVDRLWGLDTGADDYVCKPFAPLEVMARVRALLRRAEGRLTKTALPWEIHDSDYRISWRGQALALTRIEFFMLRLLLSHPGRVFSRSQLLDCVHSGAHDISDRTIDTHVKNIRRKIAAADIGADCLASVYGLGYRYDPP